MHLSKNIDCHVQNNLIKSNYTGLDLLLKYLNNEAFKLQFVYHHTPLFLEFFIYLMNSAIVSLISEKVIPHVK